MDIASICINEITSSVKEKTRGTMAAMFVTDELVADLARPAAEKLNDYIMRNAPEKIEQAVEKELDRMRYQRRFALTMRSTIFTLVVVAAIAILVAVLLMPVLRIYGRSMNDTLDEGDIVVSVKTGTFETGDVIAFYYNNKILVKRVIGQSGDWIDIDTDGNVYVNNVLVEEPFLKEKAFGDCNITLPYQVPDERIFVMGDNRVSSVDSRNTAVGCVAEEQVVGKIVFRVWPLSKIGSI
jgi:signal peptidase I